MMSINNIPRVYTFFENEPYVQVSMHFGYQRCAAVPQADTMIIDVDLKLKSRVKFLIETIRTYNQEKVAQHDLWWADWDFMGSGTVTRIGVIKDMTEAEFELLTTTILALCTERDLLKEAL